MHRCKLRDHPKFKHSNGGTHRVRLPKNMVLRWNEEYHGADP